MSIAKTCCGDKEPRTKLLAEIDVCSPPVVEVDGVCHQTTHGNAGDGEHGRRLRHFCCANTWTEWKKSLAKGNLVRPVEIM